MLWVGWVTLPKDTDRAVEIIVAAKLSLKEKISDHVSHETWNVEIDDMTLLDPFWGETIWGLREEG